MGSEQSHQSSIYGSHNHKTIPTPMSRFQRGATIAVSDNISNNENISSTNVSRPASPPISVCSDSDLPYISYIDQPIGDSPKTRGKIQTNMRNTRQNSLNIPSSQRAMGINKPKYPSSSHNIVVVKPAVKAQGIERDPDIVKLQNIPIFLPVMRHSLLRPSGRDPEILERLSPFHFQNICSRMQNHFNIVSTQVATDQSQLGFKIKEVDRLITKVHGSYVEKQRSYAMYAEHFASIRGISQQLARCNALLNQNLESIDVLNKYLANETDIQPISSLGVIN